MKYICALIFLIPSLGALFALSIFVPLYIHTQKQELTTALSQPTINTLNDITRQSNVFNQTLEGLVRQTQDATGDAKKKIIKQAQDFLSQYANILKTTNPKNLAQLYPLVRTVSEKLELLASANVKSGTSIENNTQFFKDLLDAGLTIQLILLYRIVQWAQGLDDAGKEILNNFIDASQRVISNSLYLISHQYQELAKAKNNPVQLMLARTLIYPIATFDREPYRAFDSQEASVLQETIVQEQTKSEKDMFARLSVEVGATHANELQKIFGE